LLLQRKHPSPLAYDMALDLDLVNQKVGGNVWPTNVAWYSAISADQSIWNGSNNVATNYDGLYTMAITGAVDAAAGPAGDGYATVKVLTNGSVSMSGMTGCGEAMSRRATLSKNGEWPLYVALNLNTTDKIKKGVILGWVEMTSKTDGGGTPDLNGVVDWIKNWIPVTSTFYSSGFTNAGINLLGSAYDEPGTGEFVVNMTADDTNMVGTVTLEDGNLTSPVEVTNVVLWAMPGNKFVVPANAVTLKMNKPSYKTGLVSGSFKHPDLGSVTKAIKGVVLQDENQARGYFLGTAQTGSFLLE
jgi:hypothetical protein